MNDDGTGGGNYSHYGVLMPGVDDLLAEMLQATTFDGYIEKGREVELQIQRDLPMVGLPTLSYLVVRNPRVDLGFEVQGRHTPTGGSARPSSSAEAPRRMAKYLLLRLLDMIPTVFLVLTLVFIAMRILPGDPALAALGDNADGRTARGCSASGWG